MSKQVVIGLRYVLILGITYFSKESPPGGQTRDSGYISVSKWVPAKLSMWGKR